MPFVNKAHREKPDDNIPGDRCYLSYKYLVGEWKKEPRWTTADRLFSELELYTRLCYRADNGSCKQCVAAKLAWQVFFIKYIMPYEDQKEAENGTI